MRIDLWYQAEFLKRSKGEPFAALAEACQRLACVTPGISWGMIRAAPMDPPAKPPKAPPPPPLDLPDKDNDHGPEADH